MRNPLCLRNERCNGPPSIASLVERADECPSWTVYEEGLEGIVITFNVSLIIYPTEGKGVAKLSISVRVG